MYPSQQVNAIVWVFKTIQEDFLYFQHLLKYSKLLPFFLISRDPSEENTLQNTCIVKYVEIKIINDM